MNPINWQNKDRPLTRGELDEIRSKLSGAHFAKESLDPLEMQLLYCGEALLREIEKCRDT